MIDFRYHLVSLMAVLIALTLGVILGAGPLQGKISDTLSSEVKRLSQQQTDLQQEKEKLILLVKADKKYLTAFTDRSLAGQLNNKKVALMKLGTVTEEMIKNQVKALETAGAKVVSQATLASGFTAPEAQNYRSSLTAPLKEKLGDTLIIDGDTEDTVMFMGLAEAVMDNTEKAVAIRNMLIKPYQSGDKEYHLLQIDQAPQDKADAVIVLSAPQSDDKNNKDKKEQNLDLSEAGLKALTVALSSRPGRGVVFLGAATTDTDLISRIRAAKLQVSTVDGITEPISTAIATLALKASLDGTIGAYGTQNEKNPLIPPVEKSE